MSSENSAVCTHHADGCSGVDPKIDSYDRLVLDLCITKFCLFHEREIQVPSMPTFLQGWGTFLPRGTSAFDIIDIRFPQLDGQPVPGITDIDFDLCFIGPGLLVHISPVHTRVDISGFWERRLSATGLRVIRFPVCQVAFIGRDFSNGFIDRRSPDITWKLIKFLIKISIFYIWMYSCNMDQRLHIS